MRPTGRFCNLINFCCLAWGATAGKAGLITFICPHWERYLSRNYCAVYAIIVIKERGRVYEEGNFYTHSGSNQAGF